MSSSGLYILYEGFLREVVSELDDSIIIENGSEYIVLAKKHFPFYTLRDLSESDYKPDSD